MNKNLKIGLVGATGAVGQEILLAMEKLHMPIERLELMASARSAGKEVNTAWGKKTIINVADAEFNGLDIVFFSAGGNVSKQYAHKALDAGAYIIDNTSAFRMQEDIALVVPEVNAQTLPKRPAIIANPNCSTIQLVLALKPLHDAATLKTVRVATYQSCSGAGQKGSDALWDETKQALAGNYQKNSKVHAKGIAFNVVPQIGAFLDNGYTEEEDKMMQETRKILQTPKLGISATCVRVPVHRGHSEVIHITTQEKLSVQKAKALLSQAEGLILADAEDRAAYPTPIQAEGSFNTYIGRVREDEASTHGLTFWCVSDNLVKGAALNAVQIAQCLIDRANKTDED